jgi:hypothetical protein
MRDTGQMQESILPQLDHLLQDTGHITVEQVVIAWTSVSHP